MMRRAWTGPIEWAHRLEGVGRQPPLVLLHGFTGSGSVWDDVVRSLSDERRCLIPDLPGHGATIGPSSSTECSLAGVADGLSELCRGLGLESVVVWGYSMGGRLALQWAVRDPGRISALVLESASPGLSDPGERLARKAADDQLADRILAIGVPAFAGEWMANPLFASQGQLPIERREQGRRIRESNTASGLAMSLRGMGTGVQEPLHDHLKDLPMPVLILAGERDAKFCAIGEQMSSVIPHATFRIVSGAGHAASWEQPGMCAGVVRWYLERVQPGHGMGKE